MDILLIDPPYISLKGIATDCGYNIGLTSLAAYLRRDGIEAAILSGDFTRLGPEVMLSGIALSLTESVLLPLPLAGNKTSSNVQKRRKRSG